MPFVMPDLIRHPVWLMTWIPAFAGMTDTRQAAGYWTRSEKNKETPPPVARKAGLTSSGAVRRD